MKILGHKREMKFLRDAVDSKRIHQSYLFCGADGIGKRLVAEWFAALLFCENNIKSATAPCFECVQCQKVTHRTHPDFKFIEREEEKKDISVEQMRDLKEAIQMHPMEASRKVIVINDAERMNASAANSMLKTLEEPPSDTHFILVSGRPHMLLPTILSRCQTVQFSPLAESEIAKYLKDEKGVEHGVAEFVSHVSVGSLGFAVDFPEEVISEVAEFIKKSASGISPSDVIATSDRWSKSGDNQVAILAALAAVYNDIVTCRACGSPPKFKLLSEQIDKLAASISDRSLKTRIGAIFAAQSELEATYNKQLMFEQLLFTLQA